MSKSVTIDAATAAKLNRTAEPVSLVDEAGHLVGYFSPRPTIESPPYSANFSEEELSKWEDEGGGRTLKEIMADLSKLP